MHHPITIVSPATSTTMADKLLISQHQWLFDKREFMRIISTLFNIVSVSVISTNQKFHMAASPLKGIQKQYYRPKKIPNQFKNAFDLHIEHINRPKKPKNYGRSPFRNVKLAGHASLRLKKGSLFLVHPNTHSHRSPDVKHH